MPGFVGEGPSGKAIDAPTVASVSAKPFPTSRDFPATALRRAADAVLNLVYPERCFICSVAVSRHQDCGLCPRCWDECLRLSIHPPWCPSCGIPFQGFDPDSGHLCSRCILDPPPFSGARSFGYYTAHLSRTIQEFKFRGRKDLVRLLAPLLAGALVDSWECDGFDFLIPVPLHPKRKRKRGYNQAGLLARSLSRLVGIPCCERALMRVRDTAPQVGLSDSERSRNVRNVFQCVDQAAICGKRLLLIDDVMTTGATLASAAQTLLVSGALRVSTLTLARAVTNP
jgi:ComF family protein